jgi:hypothetical protein
MADLRASLGSSLRMMRWRLLHDAARPSPVKVCRARMGRWSGWLRRQDGSPRAAAAAAALLRETTLRGHRVVGGSSAVQ